MRIPIAPAGLPLLGVALSLALISGWAFRQTGHTLFAVVAAVAGAGFGSLLWFYRDPDRPVGNRAGLVISPADGTVRRVFATARGTTVEIFMSPLNVHVNRAPIGGRVVSRRFTKGAYLAAYDDSSGSRNTRCATRFATPRGTVGVLQVAGALARKVECWVKPGDRVVQGERMGIIHLGSQVRVDLPRRARVLVKPGDKMRAGLSRIAKW